MKSIQSRHQRHTKSHEPLNRIEVNKRVIILYNEYDGKDAYQHKHDVQYLFNSRQVYPVPYDAFVGRCRMRTTHIDHGVIDPRAKKDKQVKRKMIDGKAMQQVGFNRHEHCYNAVKYIAEENNFNQVIQNWCGLPNHDYSGNRHNVTFILRLIRYIKL
jgi:hypothetical protein